MDPKKLITAFDELKKDKATYIMILKEILRNTKQDPVADQILRVMAAQALTLEALCPGSTYTKEIKDTLREVAKAQSENIVGAAAADLLKQIQAQIPDGPAP